MNGWTPERRLKQSLLIQSWRPWEKSTGAKTELGKSIASKNRKKSIEQAIENLQQAEAKLLKLSVRAYINRK